MPSNVKGRVTTPIVNAPLSPYLNNAVKMVQDHYTSPDDIDAAMKLGGGYPMGPFELLDEIGLDVAAHVLRSLRSTAEEKDPVPAAVDMALTRGWLGKKSGRGFYVYDTRRRKTTRPMLNEPADGSIPPRTAGEFTWM